MASLTHSTFPLQGTAAVTNGVAEVLRVVGSELNQRYQAWREARARARSEDMMWALAQRDPRVMAELRAAKWRSEL